MGTAPLYNAGVAQLGEPGKPKHCFGPANAATGRRGRFSEKDDVEPWMAGTI